MEYVLLAVGAAVGVYLLRQRWQGRARDDIQHNNVVLPTPGHGCQAQAGFQRSRLFEEGCTVPADFEKYRVSRLMK